ncbi:MAG TPA: regulatory signaling modulator protein AmpE [Gammaproteobacteria bacterium]|jgi:membrane protein required for beta-lactamase induction|nr:regulatory signaling modulator protein AmpE [Gammaproteobacteria bacterium]
MIFVVMCVALVVERFFDWSHVRRWGWFTGYQKWLSGYFTSKSDYVALVVVLLPLILGVLMLDLVLRGAFYGLLRFVFESLLLLYCLGPQNLWANSIACANAESDQSVDQNELTATFGVVMGTEGACQKLSKGIFVGANDRVFAPLFWFLFLGPVGAVCYRSLSHIRESGGGVAQRAQVVIDVLNWLPARLLALVFGLGNHFTAVFHCWRKQVVAGLQFNEQILADCGAAAFPVANDIAGGGLKIKQKINLLDRSLVIAVLLVAIIRFLVI